MIINLMLPSRKRAEKCLNFCKSVVDTVDDINRITFSLVIDKSDDSYAQYKELLKDIPNVNFLEQPDVGEFPGLVWYWHYIIERTSKQSDVYAMIADDMECKSKGWDTTVVNYFDSLPDKIGMIHFNENGPHGNNLCINSFIHKKWVEVVGFYNDIRLKGDFSDNFIYEIANGIGRRKYVQDQIIEHQHWMVNKGVKDDTAVRRASIDNNLDNGMTSQQFYFQHSRILVIEAINKLKHHIEISK